MKRKTHLVVLLLTCLGSSVTFAQVHDPLIQNIINSVNLDTLVHYVRILSGEDSVQIGAQKYRITNRSSSSSSHNYATEYLKQTLQGFGLYVYEQTFTSGGRTGRNVYAIQAGITNPGIDYIICAHYDGVTTYSADDDASGCAAVLESARLLSKRTTACNIVYAFWDMEEIGLIGSQYYASHNTRPIGGVLNLEMFGWDSNNDGIFDIHTRSYAGSVAMATVLKNLNTVYGFGLTPVTHNPGTTSSDHSSFWDYGYSAIVFGQAYWAGDFNPYYHSSNDRISRFNLPYFHKLSRLAVAAVAYYAQVNATVGRTLVWSGTTSSNWNTTTNWAGRVIPSAGDHVAFPSTGVINEAIISTAVTTGNLDVGTNRSVTFDAGGSLTVNGVLAMGGGKILLGNNDLTIAPAGSISVSGAVPTSFIVTNGTGMLKQTVGNADVLFPVAAVRTTSAGCPNAYSYNGVTLNNAGGTADMYGVRAWEGVSHTPVDPGSTVNREWRIVESVAGGSNLTLSFMWNNNAASGCGDTPIPLGTPSIGQWRTTTNTWWPFGATFDATHNPYAVVTSNNAFTEHPMPLFSYDFAVGGAEALPVQLITFTGTILSNSSVRLDWATASEVNNYGFYVQKRIGGAGEWVELQNSFVPGHGTTTTPREYSFTDYSTATAGLQYRLKQVDLDGAIHFSDPISVSSLTSVNESTPVEFALHLNYPNPFNPSTHIRFDLPENSDVRVGVYDMLGREVSSLISDVLSAGSHEQTWNARDRINLGLASGVYVVRVDATSVTSGRRFFAQQKVLLLK